MYIIYCNRAWDHLPYFSEERRERSKTYTNCDGNFRGATDQPFHWHHRLILMDAAYPVAYGSHYVRLTGPMIAMLPLVTGMGKSRPEVRLSAQWRDLITTQLQIIGRNGISDERVLHFSHHRGHDAKVAERG